MPNMSEYVAALASEIGPRPAGTEEEQNAALYIEDTLKQTAALPTQVEEFEGATGNDMTRLICAGVAVVAALMFMITPALAIPGLLLGLAAVVVFGADFMGKPLIARLFSKGISQNVVAKYVPAGQQNTKGRKRKVIIVTRYDSGKVRQEMKQPFVRFLGIANRVSAGAIVFILFWMLFRAIFFMYPAGVVAIVLNVIMVLAMLAAALPLILRIFAQTASYNDGANSSAAGVAVMMEVAKRVADSEFAAPQDEEVVVHDFQTAYEEGVVPDGAEVVYSAAPSGLFEEAAYDQSEEEPAEEPYQAAEPIAEVAEEPIAQPEPQPEVFVPAEAPVVEMVAPVAAAAIDAGVPDWFKSAQAKAKKSEAPASATGYRSRYADAFDAMAAERAAAQAAAEQAAAEKEAAERAAAIEAVRQAAAQAEAERLAAQREQQEAAAAAAVQQEEEPVAVEQVEAEAVEPVAAEFAHDGSNADILPDMLAEGRESIPQVSDLDMPSFLFSEQQGEEAPQTQPEAQEYVENVADFVGADDAQATAELPSISVVLPDFEEGLAPIEDLQQQRAPLADGATADNGSVAAKGLLNMLPTIDAAPADAAPGRPALNLPSLSGAFAPVTASSGSAGMTGSFAPVGDQLVATAEDPEDVFIDDVDESAFEENFTETGAFAGPDYVEMPKSRFGGLFGGLFKKGGSSSRRAARNEEPSSAAEWLDVDEDFDARSVGAARGDWSSFQEDSEWEGGATVAFEPVSGQDLYEDDFIDDEYEEEPRRWEGGAFSAVKDKVAGAASGAAGAIGSVRDRLPFGGQDPESAPSRSRSRSRRQVESVEMDMDMGMEMDMPAERPSRNRAERKDPFGGLGLNFTEEPKAFAYQEDEKIEQFQNPGIKTEVWFVALGADMDGNAGMRAFLDTHASELRGAMILEIEGVGAGELSLVSSEGSLKPIKGSSRMKRYIRKAGQALGASLPSVELPWNDSASACATAHGCQALHLAGIENGAVALLGHAEDVAENIDEEAMLFAADYVMEVIRAV